MPGHSLKKVKRAWIFAHDRDFIAVLTNLPALNDAANAHAVGKPRPFSNQASGNDPDVKAVANREAAILDAVQRWEVPASSPYRPKARDDYSLILELLRQLVKELKRRRNADGSHTPPNLWRSDVAPPPFPPDDGAVPPEYDQPDYDQFVEGYVLEFETELAQKPNIDPIVPNPTGNTELARVASMIRGMTAMISATQPRALRRTRAARRR
jgi:hypothetical protein